jgi:hypothetical protein
MSTKASFIPQMARLFAARAGLYCMSALIAGAFGIASLLAWFFSILQSSQPGQWDPVTLWRSMTFSRQLVFVFGSFFACWAPILIVARGACRITTEQLSGRPLSLAHVLVDMLRFVPAALVYSLIIGFPAMMGSTMLFFPGVLIASLFALVVPTATNEQAGIFATWCRGVSLATRVYGRLLLITIACCAFLIVVVVLRIIGVDQFLSGSGLIIIAARLGLMYIPGLLLLVLANICFTLLYVEARNAETTVGLTPEPPHP